MTGKLRTYTMEQVAKHNKKEDGWIVVHGKVWDSLVQAIVSEMHTSCDE
jgi:hypothetical protein